MNKGAVTITREQHLPINPGALESAAMSPRNLFQYESEDDVSVLACRLIVALSPAHAFIQGNKRTAWLSGVMFLNINGYDIVLPSIEANQFIGEEMTKIIRRETTEAAFLTHLDRFIVAL